MFRVMKSKKSKLSDKLGTLKQGISAPEVNPLDEEIAFDIVDRTIAENAADDLILNAEIPAVTPEEEAAAFTNQVMSVDSAAPLEEENYGSNSEGEIQGDYAAIDQGHTEVAGQNFGQDTEAQTFATDPEAEKTAIASSSPDSESTLREITAGRQLPRDMEKVSYGDVYESEEATSTKNSVGGLLKHVEQLRVSQEKINDLETEIEDLRRENDEILSAADTFKVLSEDYYEQLEKLKIEMLESRETSMQENKILKDSLVEREKLVHELKQSNADLKSKVETNFKQIRKRERDLEYRLEMAKVEETTLLKSKDKSILELRRKVDKLEQEMEAYREKNKEHYQKLQQQQQTVRGVVRALRIALTRLEGDFGVDFEVLKKAE